MKNKRLKILSLLGVTSIILNPTVSFAYNLDANGDSTEEIEYQNTDNQEFENKTSVFAEIGSKYEVTIPKIIVLSGKDKTANYYVKTTGDIAACETVNVVPDETFLLYTKDKNSQSATVLQNKTSWKYDDFDIDASGAVKAPGITAGYWTGTFNFNIDLKSEEKLEPGLYKDDKLVVPWDRIMNAHGFVPAGDNNTYAVPGFLEDLIITNKADKLVIDDSIIKLVPNAFVQSSLEEVVFPDTMTELPEILFSNCTNLKRVTFPKGITEIPPRFFMNCSGLTEMEIPDSVNRIGDMAFYGCENLENITIPKSVKSVGMRAFVGCKKANLNVSKELTSIGEHAFDDVAAVNEY